MGASENILRDWKRKRWFISVLFTCLVDAAQVEGELFFFLKENMTNDAGPTL